MSHDPQGGSDRPGPASVRSPWGWVGGRGVGGGGGTKGVEMGVETGWKQRGGLGSRWADKIPKISRKQKPHFRKVP